MSMDSPELFSDWLQAMGVRHTAAYSDAQFRAMPFRTLFGLGKLLESYGVDSCGISVADKTELSLLPAPFLAQMADSSLTIVISAAGGTVKYLSQGMQEECAESEFADSWTGVAMLASPGAHACEPDYHKHRFAEIMTRLRNVGMWLSVAAAVAYLFLSHRLECHISTVLITLLDAAGLCLSFMLVQKTAGVHTRAAERVCGVLQKGGCDDILATRASTFMGIFHWSEVGLAYFGVSLLTLLLFPDRIHDLALINLCCLPYTVWSISYQRFVAKRWCTMCVGVQATLWLLFFCYLWGGALRGAWPPGIGFFALGAVYIAALLALNKYSAIFKIFTHDESTTHR